MNSDNVKRRTKIRLISYVVALICILAAWGISQTVKSRAYERELLVTHQRSVASLASYLESIESDLKKMQYVNTLPMTSGLSISLCRASAGAKSCLSELAAGDVPLSGINKFLSQASDYAAALSKKTAKGEKLTEKDYEQVAKLHEYAEELSKQISYMEEVMYSGSVDFENAVSTLGKLQEKGDLSISYADTVSDAEGTFSDYPTLIYDGPFSDNITDKESEMLKNEEEISENEAKKRASKYSSIEENKLIRQEDEKGKIAAYVYYCDGTSVAVTKNGGYLYYILSDKYAGEIKIDEKTAIEKARKYLEKYGYVSMKDSYYSDNDGICTVNFAYTQDDVICYADLIKVSVALDTGNIVALDASGYLMNHRERDISEAKISLSEAAKSISVTLTPKSSGEAVIPTDDGNEIFAYEFLCGDNAGNDVLVYIDGETRRNVSGFRLFNKNLTLYFGYTRVTVGSLPSNIHPPRARRPCRRRWRAPPAIGPCGSRPR